MEREIANVAAASAMRGFRYLAFPPIVFAAALEPPAAIQLESIAAPQLSEEVRTECPTPLVEPRPEAQPQPIPDCAAQPQPITLPERMAAPPAAAPGNRRFALLADVSAEIRRRTSP